MSILTSLIQNLLNMTPYVLMFVILPLTLWLFMTSNALTKFKFKFAKKRYAEAIMIRNDDSTKTLILPLHVLNNGNVVMKHKTSIYPYEPIAGKIAIIEEGNAIPVVKGGYIESTIVQEAMTDLGLNKEKDDENVETTASGITTTQTDEPKEKNVRKIFKWVIDQGKLKNVIIRPFTRWSSQEFKDAINSEVIKELLRIPLRRVDIMIMLTVGIGIMITAYYGYMHNQLLEEIIELLSGN